jgi:hypothetical protein
MHSPHSGPHASEDDAGLVRRLLRSHSLHCRDPYCPFSNPEYPVRLAERITAACGGNGGWTHRNLFNPIGLTGEYLTHLAIPEICLHGGIGLLSTPMDGNTPRGEAEIKTATACAHTNGETRWSFSVRSSQRRDHALPMICVGMAAGFLEAFDGRPLVLPTDTSELVGHVAAVFLVPLAAYPVPARTFIISTTPARELPIRALQVLFRCSYRELHRLGVDGLCRLRSIFDHPSKVLAALEFVETLSGELSAAELWSYQSDPHRLLADAEAYALRAPLNERVKEALALDTLRRARAHRTREQQEAERRIEADDRMRRDAEDRSLRVELAFALLGILTLAAGRPLTALEMRHRYGLRRDHCFPPAFGREALGRGIAVCADGERRRVASAEGNRERRITLTERREMDARLAGWLRLVRSHHDHPFVLRVTAAWDQTQNADPVARAALNAIHSARRVVHTQRAFTF